tara:strand:+ start:171 stop:554 length:384 start_codon:yes stop_codon:yes gene_type:complete
MGVTKKVKGSKSVKAGLTVPASRVNRAMKQRSGMKRVGGTAPVYLAAVMEYLVAEILEVALNAAHNDKRKRVTPADVSLALRSDPDLNKICGNISLYSSDKLEGIAHQLLPAPRAQSSKNNEGETAE